MSRADTVPSDDLDDIGPEDYDDMARTLRAEGFADLADRFERIADGIREGRIHV